MRHAFATILRFFAESFAALDNLSDAWSIPAKRSVAAASTTTEGNVPSGFSDFIGSVKVELPQLMRFEVAATAGFVFSYWQ